MATSTEALVIRLGRLEMTDATQTRLFVGDGDTTSATGTPLRLSALPPSKVPGRDFWPAGTADGVGGFALTPKKPGVFSSRLWCIRQGRWQPFGARAALVVDGAGITAPATAVDETPATLTSGNTAEVEFKGKAYAIQDSESAFSSGTIPTPNAYRGHSGGLTLLSATEGLFLVYGQLVGTGLSSTEYTLTLWDQTASATLASRQVSTFYAAAAYDQIFFSLMTVVRKSSGTAMELRLRLTGPDGLDFSGYSLACVRLGPTDSNPFTAAATGGGVAPAAVAGP